MREVDASRAWLGGLRSSLGTEGPLPEAGQGERVAFHHSLHLLLSILSPGLMPKMVCQCRRRDAVLSDCTEGFLLF